VTMLWIHSAPSTDTWVSPTARSGAQRGEERAQRVTVGALAGPHLPARRVVDDPQQVAMPLAVGDLVYTDALQARQPVGPPGQLRGDPHDDADHRAPGHPYQPDHHRLRRVRGQPRHRVFKSSGASKAYAKTMTVG
jgi:hypothetical protein